MSGFTLDDLLNSLTKSAADESAEGGNGGEGENDKKEKGTEGKDKKKEDKGDSSKSESESGSEPEEGKGQEKSAAFKAGSDLAKEVLEKVAQIKENTMNGQTTIAGRALADAILTKLASVGDTNTDAGVGTAVPNKTQQDLAAQVAEDDAKIKGVPGAGGSMNEIFDSIVADAAGQGAAAYDSVPHLAGSAVEGDPNETATPNQEQVEDDHEKIAAVLTLMDQGVDFDSAVAMVKEAGELIDIEVDGQIKQAAVGELIEQGFDFDTAVALVKEASFKDAATGKFASQQGSLVPAGRVSSSESLAQAAARHGRNAASAAGRKASNVGAFLKAQGAAVKADAKTVAPGLKALASPGKFAAGLTRGAVAKSLMHNKAIQAGAAVAGLAGIGGAAYAHHQKKAAFDMLVDQGVDFATAAGLVESKSQELYGI